MLSYRPARTLLSGDDSVGPTKVAAAAAEQLFLLENSECSGQQLQPEDTLRLLESRSSTSGGGSSLENFTTLTSSRRRNLELMLQQQRLDQSGGCSVTLHFLSAEVLPLCSPLHHHHHLLLFLLHLLLRLLFFIFSTSCLLCDCCCYGCYCCCFCGCCSYCSQRHHLVGDRRGMVGCRVTGSAPIQLLFIFLGKQTTGSPST